MTDPNQMEHPVSPSESPAQAAPSNAGEQVPRTDFQTASEQAPSSVQQASAPQEQPPVQPAQAAQQGPFQAPPQPNQPNYTTYTPGGYYTPQPPYPPANYQPPYQQNYYNQPAPPPGYPQPPAYPPYPQQKYKPEGLAIACMVLGICSIPLGSLVCAILALVFASRVKSHYPNGNLGPNTNYVKAGKICGIVGLVFWVILIVLMIICIAISIPNGTLNYYYNFSY